MVSLQNYNKKKENPIFLLFFSPLRKKIISVRFLLPDIDDRVGQD